MKKVILLFGALAIIALAVFNLNLTINSESKVNVSSASILSVAAPEGGSDCDTDFWMRPISDCDGWEYVSFCIHGSKDHCLTGEAQLADDCGDGGGQTGRVPCPW